MRSVNSRIRIWSSTGSRRNRKAVVDCLSGRLIAWLTALIANFFRVGTGCLPIRSSNCAGVGKTSNGSTTALAVSRLSTSQTSCKFNWDRRRCLDRNWVVFLHSVTIFSPTREEIRRGSLGRQPSLTLHFILQQPPSGQDEVLRMIITSKRHA